MLDIMAFMSFLMYFLDLLQIAFRSIRQRGVASLLTMFSMSLGVMLVVAVLSIHGVVTQSFATTPAWATT